MDKRSHRYNNKIINHFNGFRENVNSQYGEDGIIAELLKILGIYEGLVVDVGAWDGIKYSNVFELIKEGYKGILIECDAGKFEDLVKLAETYPQIKAVNESVTAENAHSLIDYAESVQVLNIDTDGDDAGIWKSMGPVADIAVIEWNDRGNIKDQEVMEVADAMGYTLVAITNSNMIFVINNEMDAITEAVQ